MDPLLELLQENAKLSVRELADRLGEDEDSISRRIEEMERDKVILGYHGVIDREKAGDHTVAALIEVKLTIERGQGFDHLAERIAAFDQVSSCYLMSGGYDLAVIVEGEDLREVARFVTEKLSTLDGVLSTATHFQLKVYKQSGFRAASDAVAERLPVTP